MTTLTEKDVLKIKQKKKFSTTTAIVYSLNELDEMGITDVLKLPYSIRVLLENIARNIDGKQVTLEDLVNVASWFENQGKVDVPYMPARVVLQDFTGVPLIVDLAAIREIVHDKIGSAKEVNPRIPTDLVVDHSIQIDYFGIKDALKLNLMKEFERNKERYKLLKWAKKSFENFEVIPPGSGIIHQVNLEYLGKVVQLRKVDGEMVAYPDSLLGTDSHTPMINSLGIIGWGVGGIEAEAVMLGLPYNMILPEVVGVKLVGELQDGVTATDLVLTITETLRKRSVVGKFVEYFGPGLKNLLVPDRATISNMSPEYGATMGFFPVDEITLEFLMLTNRGKDLVKLVEEYTKYQHLFYDDTRPEPKYSEIIEIDLGEIEPSISGPAHPEDRIPLRKMKNVIRHHLQEYSKERGHDEEFSNNSFEKKKIKLNIDDEEVILEDGSLVIAAITSCTNTSNPTLMIAAGLVAKKAVEHGLLVKKHVKTSLAPGSRVVTKYLEKLNLLPYLEALRFHVAGYGCTTCIGNSGPLHPDVEKALLENNIYAASILSGNRNFSGRIHPLARGNFLASPPLVVAFALAGRIDLDPFNEPIGYDPVGRPVYLKDIWPSSKEIREHVKQHISSELFEEIYGKIKEGDENWNALDAKDSMLFNWEENSTYIRLPPYFENFELDLPPLENIKGARVLLLLKDRISTDHISPAGVIAKDSPAGKYLMEQGVPPEEFNTYGSRRGNHEVMMRGTFANPRYKNHLVPDKEGGWTVHLPTGKVMRVYDTAIEYKKTNTPLIILAGEQYGVGSSRDWAAKGTALLGVKAVIAKSYERIHKSNLIGMGVLPLEFMNGDDWESLGLDGSETFDIMGIKEGLEPRKILDVVATKTDGTRISFKVRCKLDTPMEKEYYENGGIMPYIAREIIKKNS